METAQLNSVTRDESMTLPDGRVLAYTDLGASGRSSCISMGRRAAASI